MHPEEIEYFSNLNPEKVFSAASHTYLMTKTVDL